MATHSQTKYEAAGFLVHLPVGATASRPAVGPTQPPV